MASRCCWCCGDGEEGAVPLEEMPAVQLDTQRMGTDVVIVKNGRRICGTGGCLANAPLHQTKSYFEFKIQSTGIWGIGVATEKANLNQVPLGQDVHSLVLRNDGTLYYNKEEKNRLPVNSLPQEGDVVLTTVLFWIVSSVIFFIHLHQGLKRSCLSSKSSECLHTERLDSALLLKFCHLK
ncbi:SPRY domain-containing protein 7 isoform X2 [Phaenicophaeus curvirostris]|uniref:SPRY domain-containing protein 7 isoform X2 n=1 Tax=Phaenicophaeus curvirostris TaxID=33595 RepID=UPI0037F09A69